MNQDISSSQEKLEVVLIEEFESVEIKEREELFKLGRIGEVVKNGVILVPNLRSLMPVVVNDLNKDLKLKNREMRWFTTRKTRELAEKINKIENKESCAFFIVFTNCLWIGFCAGVKDLENVSKKKVLNSIKNQLRNSFPKKSLLQPIRAVLKVEKLCLVEELKNMNGIVMDLELLIFEFNPYETRYDFEEDRLHHKVLDKLRGELKQNIEYLLKFCEEKKIDTNPLWRENPFKKKKKKKKKKRKRKEEEDRETKRRRRY